MKRNLYIICSCVSLFIACSLGYGQVDNVNDLPKAIDRDNGGFYYYKTENRLDPFRPFVTPKSISSTRDPNEIVDSDEKLSGMQLFEPGQLNLVGIIHSAKDSIALVEDQSKKGYVVKIGTLIGKRGVVTNIDEEQVSITETAKTRGGQELKSIITLRMKKDGEKL